MLNCAEKEGSALDLVCRAGLDMVVRVGSPYATCGILKVWGTVQSYQSIPQFVKDYQASVKTSHFEAAPLEMLKHLSDAGCVVVAAQYPASIQALNHFNFVSVSVGVWIPNYTGILKFGSYVHLVASGLNALGTNSTEKNQNTAGTLSCGLHVPVPPQICEEVDSDILGIIHGLMVMAIYSVILCDWSLWLSDVQDVKFSWM